MPIQEVYLIRHGETEWSLNGQHTGITDIPLTENGRKVAKLLAPVLAKEKFALVLTSPLKRARETCELAGLGARAEIDRDLMEWNYGEYEGLTPEEIHAQAPGWMIFTDGCPGGESPEQVGARVDRVIARVRGGGRTCRAFRARPYFQSLCGSVAWTSGHGGMSLPSRYGDAQHPELLPKRAGGEAVERHARAVGQLEKRRNPRLPPPPDFAGGMRWRHFVVNKFKEDMI